MNVTQTCDKSIFQENGETRCSCSVLLKKSHMPATYTLMLMYHMEVFYPSCSKHTEHRRIFKRNTDSCERTESLIDKRATVCHPESVLVRVCVGYSRARSI